jgi:hypothetical protein
MTARSSHCARGLAAGASLLCALALPSIAQATENGATITPFGVLDFSAGMLPPATPVGTVGFRAGYYSANVQRDDNGNDENNDFDLTVKSYALAYIKMTEAELFNASVGFGAVLPVIDIDGSLTVSTPGGDIDIAGDDFALGDMQFLPIMLQWNAPPNFFINASLQIQAPTGHYDVDNAFNAGVNHWTIAPMVGMTYISDSGFEISSRIQLSFNTENPDTDYRSGVEYLQEFAVGQHVGSWTLGVGGYAYQQLTDDSGSGATDANRGRVFALGPAISFFEPGKPVVSVHAYKEFGAENRAEGYNVAVRVGVSF